MAPQRYRLVVEGELGPRYALAFDQMTLSARDGETEITGTMIDSSHLHGVLERVASLGLTLRSLNPVEAQNGTSEAQPHRTNRELRPKPAGAPDGSLGAGDSDDTKPRGDM